MGVSHSHAIIVIRVRVDLMYTQDDARKPRKAKLSESIVAAPTSHYSGELHTLSETSAGDNADPILASSFVIPPTRTEVPPAVTLPPAAHDATAFFKNPAPIAPISYGGAVKTGPGFATSGLISAPSTATGPRSIAPLPSYLTSMASPYAHTPIPVVSEPPPAADPAPLPVPPPLPVPKRLPIVSPVAPSPRPDLAHIAAMASLMDWPKAVPIDQPAPVALPALPPPLPAPPPPPPPPAPTVPLPVPVPPPEKPVPIVNKSKKRHGYLFAHLSSHVPFLA